MSKGSGRRASQRAPPLTALDNNKASKTGFVEHPEDAQRKYELAGTTSWRFFSRPQVWATRTRTCHPIPLNTVPVSRFPFPVYSRPASIMPNLHLHLQPATASPNSRHGTALLPWPSSNSALVGRRDGRQSGPSLPRSFHCFYSFPAHSRSNLQRSQTFVRKLRTQIDGRRAATRVPLHAIIGRLVLDPR